MKKGKSFVASLRGRRRRPKQSLFFRDCFVGASRLLAMTALTLIFSRICYGQPISSTELIEKAKEYNNKEVEYQGEVVGDVMVRGDSAWVNLHDGRNAIGIFGEKDLISDIIHYKGDYTSKGDILLVRGAFHRACSEHGGDMDIHASGIVRIKEGCPILHVINTSKRMLAFALSIMTICFFVLYTVKAKTSHRR